jgi:hypothetical protein
MAKKMTSEMNPDYGQMQLSIPMASLPGGMPTVDNFKTEFMPPDLQLVVTQRAEVIIKYVGGPIYVPPSADPNYKSSFDFEPQIMVGNGTNLDQKI